MKAQFNNDRGFRSICCISDMCPYRTRCSSGLNGARPQPENNGTQERDRALVQSTRRVGRSSRFRDLVERHFKLDARELAEAALSLAAAGTRKHPGREC